MLPKQLQLLILGLLSLLVGVLIYALTRPPQTTYFLSEQLTFYQNTHKDILILTGSLPSFCHVIGFSFLILALKPNSKYISITCSFWLVINILFELSQHPNLASKLANLELPILDFIKNYARHGTFDLGDIFAVILGGIVAYALAKFIIEGKV